MRILFASFVLLISPLALASEGSLEINHACASGPGCFPGDPPGYPVVITEAGSYRLTSNLVIPNASTDGVRIASDDVSLDLAGFEVRGPTSCSGTPVVCSPTGSGRGVSGASFAGARVRNGRVIGAGSDGISLGSAAAVEDVHATSNGRDGIIIVSHGLIQNSKAHENGGHGIAGGSSVNMFGNVTSLNLGNGIDCQGACIVARNTSSSNEGNGIDVWWSALVQGNTVYSNDGDGIFAANGSSIVDNTVADSGDGNEPNTDYGIYCSTGCTVRGNTIRSNKGFGLNLGADSIFRENVITDNDVGPITGTGSSRGDNFCSGPNTVSEFCP